MKQPAACSCLRHQLSSPRDTGGIVICAYYISSEDAIGIRYLLCFYNYIYLVDTYLLVISSYLPSALVAAIYPDYRYRHYYLLRNLARVYA
jgi:hypothetical protein